MQSMKTPLLAVVLSGTVLFGAVTLSAGTPGQKGKKKPAGAWAGPNKALVAQGKKIYDAQGCAACHRIGDKGGKTGPNFSHIGSERLWTPQRLAAFIRDPKKANKRTKMPAYPADKISDKDLKALVAFLESLK